MARWAVGGRSRVMSRLPAARVDGLRPAAAEGLGTFLLVLVGGAGTLAHAPHALGRLDVALLFGLLVAVLVYALGHVSGAHFNPVITLAFAATGHFPWRRVIPYVVAQTLGAGLAALALRAVFPSVAPAATSLAWHVTPLTGVGVEAVATFLLAFVIVAVATDRRSSPTVGGLAIGFVVAVDVLAWGNLTGASMNPARSFGPALVGGLWNNFWVYLVGPATGALLGMWAFEAVRGKSGQNTGHERLLGALGPVEPET